MLEKCVLTILELSWNLRLGHKTKLNICHHALTSSTQLQNWPFHVVERTRTSTKCQKMKNAHAKRAKILFFIVKYANLWGFCCRRRRGCLSSLIGCIVIKVSFRRQYANRWTGILQSLRIKFREWKIYLWVVTLSLKPWIWKYHVLVWQTPSKCYSKVRAARAARLFFLVQPIRSFFLGMLLPSSSRTGSFGINDRNGNDNAIN